MITEKQMNSIKEQSIMNEENSPRPFVCEVDGTTITGTAVILQHAFKDYGVDVVIENQKYYFVITQTCIEPLLYSVSWVKTFVVEKLTTIENIKMLPVEQAFEKAIFACHDLYRRYK